MSQALFLVDILQIAGEAAGKPRTCDLLNRRENPEILRHK